MTYRMRVETKRGWSEPITFQADDQDEIDKYLDQVLWFLGGLRAEVRRI